MKAVPCRDYDPPSLWCAPCRRGDPNNCQDPWVPYPYGQRERDEALYCGIDHNMGSCPNCEGREVEEDGSIKTWQLVLVALLAAAVLIPLSVWLHVLVIRWAAG